MAQTKNTFKKESDKCSFGFNDARILSRMSTYFKGESERWKRIRK